MQAQLDASTVQATAAAAERDGYRTELEAARRRITDAESRYASAADAAAAAETRVQQYESMLSRTDDGELREVENRCSAATAVADSLRNRVAILEGQLEAVGRSYAPPACPDHLRTFLPCSVFCRLVRSEASSRLLCGSSRWRQQRRRQNGEG